MSEDVTQTLDRVAEKRGYPKRIKTDNGSEFTSLHYDRWAHKHQIVTDYSRRGTPTDNAIIESFNGSFRDECLSVNWFLSVEDACEKITNWRSENNTFRLVAVLWNCCSPMQPGPHSSLNQLPPEDYAESLRGRKIPQSAGTTFG